MKTFERVLLILLAALIIIQFFHPQKNVPTIKSPVHISAVYSVPLKVNEILRRACNDCHSNNTRYPWYNNIQPVAWWLNGHVKDGKRGLNFDDFATYRIAKQYHRMQDIIDEVKEGDMPLASYTLIHKDARLTDEEKNTIYNWANAIRDTIKAKYPPDSLIRKK